MQNNYKFTIYSGKVTLWELHLLSVSNSIARGKFEFRNTNKEANELFNEWLPRFLTTRTAYLSSLAGGYGSYNEIVSVLEQCCNEIIKFKLEGSPPKQANLPDLPPGITF